MVNSAFASRFPLYIDEPLEVVVIFDLSEHGFRFNRSPALMHQSLVHCTHELLGDNVAVPHVIVNCF